MSVPSRSSPPLFPVLCLGMLVIIAFVGAFAVTSVATATEPVDEAATPPDVLADTTAGTDFVTVERNDSSLIESNTTFTIELQRSGDAHWTVTERFNTSTEEQQRHFEEVADEFESENVDGSALGYESFEQAGELVDASIDRDVVVHSDERTSSVDGDTGELVLTFTWENFARIEGNSLVLDDVYETEHGLWFEGLSPNQQLIIKSPDGFGFDNANVIPEDGTLIWTGPQTFTNETLQAVLVGVSDQNGTPDGNDDTNGTDTTPATGGDDGIGSSLGLIALVLGGVGALGAVVAIAVLAVGRDRVRALLERDSKPTDSVVSEDGTGAATQVEQLSAAAGSESETDVELLSDEERVERLLEQNGGRMKQATIVKETGWSNAKVSQLLSSMEEDGQINKLRIGRENLISFPDEDITEIGDK